MSYRVIITTPTWNLSGVNTMSANLVRGLVRHGIDAKILLTRTDSLPEYHTDMPAPKDVPIETLPVAVKQNYWRDHWHSLVEYLVAQAPCIYIPNYDFEHSAVCPVLPQDVCTVGVVHSDDPEHYEHVDRLGDYWNAVVTVSDNLRKNVGKLKPALANRIVHIPNGVTCPEIYPAKKREALAPLRIVYTGRLVNYQKRILDLLEIVEGLLDIGIPFRLTLVGSGPEESRLKSAWTDLVKNGTITFTGTVSNETINQILFQSDVFILTSAFEGHPMSLLEAMGQGCVPVVTDLRSGIPELVENGHEGFRVSIGDIQAFVECLSRLQQDASKLETMSLRSFKKIRNGFTVQHMTDKYVELFNKVLDQVERNEFVRCQGKIMPPPFLCNRFLLPLLYIRRLMFKRRISSLHI